MNLRVVCLGLALLSIAATGDPCDPTSSSGVSVGAEAGPGGTVCGVTVNTPCCGAVNDPCTDNNDCCGGNCSGSSGEEAGFGSDTASCAEPANEGCTAALGSRCNSGQCTCATDDDCCLGICQTTTLPGATGRRCCLTSGSPCDAPADCCSLSCNADGQCD